MTEPPPGANVQLIGERASKAILRFAARTSDLVTGGTFADWPLVRVTQIAPANRRFDPAAGLFGLAIASREGVLADAVNRAAIARAIDRSGFVGAIAADWPVASQILPEQLDSAAAPAVSTWTLPPAADTPTPRAQIAAWQKANPVTQHAAHCAARRAGRDDPLRLYRVRVALARHHAAARCGGCTRRPAT